MLPSHCTEEFWLRKVKNDKLKVEAKAKGTIICTKRQPEGPIRLTGDLSKGDRLRFCLKESTLFTAQKNLLTCVVICED